MDKSRTFDICIIDVQRASYAKHLRGKKHLKTEKLNEMIITKCFFREPIENKIKKTQNPKPLKQLERDNNKLDDKQFNKKLAKKMINPY